jgi:hypothetical protein
MLATTQEIIRYADTKLGLLLTAVAVTAPTLQNHVLWLASRWDLASTRAVLTVVIGGAGVSLMAVAVGLAASGLMPRLRRPGPVSGHPHGSLNRFAWPTLTKTTPTAILALPDAQVREEAASQILALSVIAQRKFRRFGAGLGSAVVGGALVVTSGLVGHDFTP